MTYNKNYYPTPPDVIRKMIEPYRDQLKTTNILEPSAGMGAILDTLTYSGVNKTRLYACENDLELKSCLTGKGYKVVQENFLTYSGSLDFGLIIMNPPFDTGDQHLMKAWEIMRNGDIVCLLNEQTLINIYSDGRKELAAIIEKHGSVESLGPVFQTASRATGVNVAMVRLKKQTNDSGVDFKMKGSEAVKDFDLSSDQAEIEKRDYIAALVRAYSKAIESTRQMFVAMSEFNLFVNSFAGEFDTPKLCANFFGTARKSGFSDAHNEFTLAFQGHAWNKIFTHTKASGLMTKKVREKFDKWREEMGGIDLNDENISLLFETLIQQRTMIAAECIEDAFDKITQYRGRASADWKTNSQYMVTEKFIIPYIVEASWSGRGVTANHRMQDFLNDVDRALCLLSGKRFPVYGSNEEEKKGEINSTYDAIQQWCNDNSKPAESEFFTFTCHLKGTVHFRFKDLDLMNQLNRRACEKKGWTLPETETFRGKSRRGQKVK